MEELENYLQTIYEAKENGGIVDIKEATVKVLIMSNRIQADIVKDIMNEHK